MQPISEIIHTLRLFVLMLPCKPIIKTSLLTAILIVFLSANLFAQEGKQLFQSHCQACHSLDKNLTGPALRGFLERGPWGDRQQLYAWIHNPSAFMAADPYTQGLKAQFGSIMQAFPTLTTGEIDAIAEYISTAPAPGGAAKPGPEGAAAPVDNSGRNSIFFGIVSLILAIIALILMQVNSNLKKLSDDKENIVRPEPVPFYRNKIYIALLAVILFIIGGIYIAKGAIGLGRNQDYQPQQPIYYSHKVHAGINQISCLYCHGNAMESKHAAIPSVNVCMNCHKAISTYEKGPTLYDAEGKEVNGTAEIAKLYDYAGFDPAKPNDWKPEDAKPVEWIKIHSLPDLVYFNHSQHVKAGNVQCQTCHGPIQDMDEVKQFTDLSMGWCVNCHRTTKVDFYNPKDSTGNKFYSIYEKFHNDLKSGKMDSVTVESIGGTECQKCHY